MMYNKRLIRSQNGTRLRSMFVRVVMYLVCTPITGYVYSQIIIYGRGKINKVIENKHRNFIRIIYIK